MEHRYELVAGLRRALDAMDDAFLVLDLSGGVLHANRHAAELCDAATMAGRSFADLLPGDVAAVVGPALQRLRETGEPQNFDVRVRGARWYAGHAYPAGPEIVLHLHNVTERRLSEDALSVLADAGAVLASEPHPEELLGAALQLVVPRLGDWGVAAVEPDASDPLIYRVVASRPAIRTRLERTVRQCGVARLLHEARGSTRPLVLSAHTAEGAGGGLCLRSGADRLVLVPIFGRTRRRGVLVVGRSRGKPAFLAHDILIAETLGRRLGLVLENAWFLDAAERATRLRDDVLAIVAHDLRSPLNAIVLAATALPESNDAQHHVLQEVARTSIVIAADQMNRLLDDLLDAARLDAGWAPRTAEGITVADLVNRTLDTFRQRAAQEGVTLEVQLGSLSRVLLWGDQVRLQQALGNLVDNAIRFTPREGRVKVAAARVDGYVDLTVSDRGPGIPPDVLPHLFDRFWQARRSGRGGAGLGLFIARRVAEGHRGQVKVASELGRGSSFHLILPLHGQENGPEPEKGVE